MVRQRRSLSGLTVAITGGGRGIGRETAAAFLRRGARVAIGDIDGDLARRTAAELGGGVVGLDLDVTDRESFTAFLDEAEQSLGAISVLVNNAGIMPLARLVEESDGTARSQVDINLHGALLGTKLGLSRMLARGGGHIVNVASTAGKAGLPGAGTYCATKHAVVGLSEVARAESRGTDVGVSVVLPAMVNTELISGLEKTRGLAVSEPEEVADAIVDAVERRRFEVYVPGVLGPMLKFMGLLPIQARERIWHALGGDRVLANPDVSERAAYSSRAGETSQEQARPGPESTSAQPDKR